jgi:hypothetical protein
MEARVSTFETELRKKQEFMDRCVEGLHLLRRVVWELSDGAEYSGNKVTDATYDRAQTLLQEVGL